MYKYILHTKADASISKEKCISRLDMSPDQKYIKHLRQDLKFRVETKNHSNKTIIPFESFAA